MKCCQKALLVSKTMLICVVICPFNKANRCTGYTRVLNLWCPDVAAIPASSPFWHDFPQVRNFKANPLVDGAAPAPAPPPPVGAATRHLLASYDVFTDGEPWVSPPIAGYPPPPPPSMLGLLCHVL